MSKNTPGVPYPYIKTLPGEDQRRLERDFEHLRLNIPDAIPTVYDAIIDPRHPSDASIHRYINLTELIANEDWSTPQVFHVGVYQPHDVPIEEPSQSLSITTKGHLALHGILQAANGLSGAWDWATLSVAVGQSVWYRNLHISSTEVNF